MFPNKVLLDGSELHSLDALIQSGSDTSMAKYVQWFSSRGAYKTAGVSTQVVIENDRSHPIRIIEMNVVKKCGPPVKGTFFMAAGGAEEQSIGLGFSLDSSDTNAEVAQGIGPSEWKPHYFASYTISIEPGEQQVLNLFAFTTKAACSFNYSATVLDGDKKVYQLIGNGTTPFRVTSVVLSLGNPYPFSNYQAAYMGGALTRNGAFVRVNAATYRA